MKAIKKIALLLVVLLVIIPVIPAQAGTMEKTVNLIENDQPHYGVPYTNGDVSQNLNILYPKMQ